jgi:beta-galactosidase
VEPDGDAIVVRSTYRTGAGIDVLHTMRFTSLEVDGDCGLLLEEAAVIPAGLADLPRVGTVFEVSPGLDRVDWLDPGPWESYPDRRAGGALGWHGAAVGELRTPYLRPQENGGRHGVRRFTLTGESRLEIVLDVPRQVSWAHHHATDLDAATHDGELTARPDVVVHVDAAHRGVGTASCGPDTLPEYLVGPGTYEWSWVLLG